MKKILFLFSLLVCANCLYAQTDSIKASSNAQAVFENAKQYYYFKDIAISNYYICIDTLKINLNDDDVDDYLLILSPYVLENPESFLLDSNAKELLVSIVSSSPECGKFKISQVYSNVIPSEACTLSSFNGIKLTNKGFCLTLSKGMAYVYHYVFYFERIDYDFCLSKVKRICDFRGKEKKRWLKTKKIRIEDFNSEDFIDSCNCEKDWSVLENSTSRREK
jgi:hypothetical protein